MRVKAIILCLVITGTLYAQPHKFKWMHSVGQASMVANYLFSVDNDGNSFVLGSYSGSLTVSSSTFAPFSADPFLFDKSLSKWNTLGGLDWTIQINLSGGADFQTVETDANGDVYLLGYAGDSVFTIASQSIPAGNYTFLCKISGAGNVLWIKKIMNGGPTFGCHLVMEKNDFIVIGNFSSTSLAVSGNTYFLQGVIDMFVGKFDYTGHAMWFQSIGTVASDRIAAIGVNDYADIFITGEFGGPEIVIGTDTLTSSAATSMFLSKLDSSGHVIWSWTAAGHVSSADLCVFNNDVYVCGGYNGQVSFDGITFSGKEWHGYLARFDPNKNMSWVTSANVIKEGAAVYSGIVCDRNGTIFLSGAAFGTVVVCADTFLSDDNYYDALLVSFNITGKCLGAIRSQAVFTESADGIEIDALDNVYTLGQFEKGISFGGKIMGGSEHDQSVFLAKLVAKPVGLNENLDLGSDIEFFPNPAGRTLKIHARNSVIRSAGIYNTNGVCVFWVEKSVESDIINLPSLLSGLYFLRIETSRGNYTDKILIEQD